MYRQFKLSSAAAAKMNPFIHILKPAPFGIIIANGNLKWLKTCIKVLRGGGSWTQQGSYVQVSCMPLHSQISSIMRRRKRPFIINKKQTILGCTTKNISLQDWPLAFYPMEADSLIFNGESTSFSIMLINRFVVNVVFFFLFADGTADNDTKPERKWGV